MWTALAASLIAIAILTAWLLRRKPVRRKAMKALAQRVARDPAYAQSVSQKLSERSAAIDAANTAPAPTDTEIPDLVSGLISRNDTAQMVARIRLEKAGARANPALLAALVSSRCTWAPESSQMSAGSSAARVAELLWRFRCRELGRHIGQLCDRPDWRVYRHAIRARAALGLAADAPWMIQVLNDSTIDNAGMRHTAIEEGVQRAIEERLVEPGLTAALLAWARENVHNPQHKPSAWAVRFYVEHGGSQALSAIQSPALLGMNNDRNIHIILEQLTARGVEVPPQLLDEIARKSLSTDRWPWSCTFPHVLASLALRHPDQALSLATAQLDRSDGAFARDAIKFIELATGLPKSWQTSPPEDMPLTPEERTLLMHIEHVSQATGQICNGGLSQYFFNSSGDHWPRDVEAFRAIGYPQGAGALDKAARIVHRDGASLDRSIRTRQYAALPDDREAELDELSGLFWGDHVDRVTLRYMLRHADLFRRVKAARHAAGWDADA